MDWLRWNLVAPGSQTGCAFVLLALCIVVSLSRRRRPPIELSSACIARVILPGVVLLERARGVSRKKVGRALVFSSRFKSVGRAGARSSSQSSSECCVNASISALRAVAGSRRAGTPARSTSTRGGRARCIRVINTPERLEKKKGLRVFGESLVARHQTNFLGRCASQGAGAATTASIGSRTTVNSRQSDGVFFLHHTHSRPLDSSSRRRERTGGRVGFFSFFFFSFFFFFKMERGRVVAFRLSHPRLFRAALGRRSGLAQALCAALVARAVKLEACVDPVGEAHTHVLLLYYARLERGLGWHRDDGPIAHSRRRQASLVSLSRVLFVGKEKKKKKKRGCLIARRMARRCAQWSR